LTPLAALRKLPNEGNVLIARLTGKLIQKQPNAIIVDVGGVGYELIVPLSTFYDLGPLGSDVTLRAYTYVREDALQLYGFHSDRERRLFLLLTSVSGIGPRLAITVLSGLNAEELILAIQQNNLARLVSIPGVGKKTAERLIVELRDKVATLAGTLPEDSMAGVTGQESSTIRDDLISALVNLGYQRNAADKAVTTAFAEDASSTFESALKRALRTLSR
jgi:Holliday junction DNA helicase RuvA